MKTHITEIPARIEWLTENEGGRKVPPAGPTYVAPVRLSEADPDFEHGYWSLNVELVNAPDAFHWFAKIRYLVDEAPHHLLKQGRAFELHEGRRVVGRGVIANHGG